MKRRIFNTTLTIAISLGGMMMGYAQSYTPEQVEQLEQLKRQKIKEAKENQSPYTMKSASPEQDCPDAIIICQDVYSQTQSYQGTGNIPNEINPGLSCLDDGEMNDVWYIFTAQQTGIVNFTITPLNPLDDYDWAVFNLTNATCSEIFVNPALEVACNFSAIAGPTGANNNPGAQNTSAINVMAGQTFVVNISNFSATQSGYTIDFTASSVTLYDTVPPTAISSEYVCNNYGVRITLDEPCTCSTIAPDGSDFSALNQQGVAIQVLGAVGVGCSQNNKYTTQVDVIIAAQTQAIPVTITLQQGTDGNTIGDKCLNWMVELNETVTVQPKPTLELGGDQLLCFFGVSYPLLDASNQWQSFKWYRNGVPLSGDTLQTYQVTSTGVYSVIVNNYLTADPCIYSDTVVVDVSVDYCLENLPNAFSPNSDGINDLYLEGADMIIMNRWGQTLYKGATGWDGTHNGAAVSNGTYYVIFKFIDSQGQEHTIKQPVTLIR